MEMKSFLLQFSFLCLVESVIIFQIYCASDVVFYESFQESFEGRWIVSEKDGYKGVWKHAKSEGHDDYGLLVSKKAKTYAIVKELSEPLIVKNRTIVLQFEIRFQNGFECGGAYLKYLSPQKGGWKPEEFDNESPYTFLFGPYKCGSKNKVLFILRHKNPNSGKYIEHHLKSPPTVPSDKLSHVYTAILKPDNSLMILIDGKQTKHVNFLVGNDFEPPIIPTKTITDLNDPKPANWDEREKIEVVKVVKTSDWDDEVRTKKEDYEETHQEDRNDEENGMCKLVPKSNKKICMRKPSYGEWSKLIKKSPTCRRKWYTHLIDNPNYNGVWKAREIPNPYYFELDKPDFENIVATGIEIWTAEDGILFDNILIATSEEVAKTIRKETWKPKFKVEKENQEIAKEVLVSFLKPINKRLVDLIKCSRVDITWSITWGTPATVSVRVNCFPYVELSFRYEFSLF